MCDYRSSTIYKLTTQVIVQLWSFAGFWSWVNTKYIIQKYSFCSVQHKRHLISFSYQKRIQMYMCFKNYLLHISITDLNVFLTLYNIYIIIFYLIFSFVLMVLCRRDRLNKLPIRSPSGRLFKILVNARCCKSMRVFWCIPDQIKAVSLLRHLKVYIWLLC